MSDRTPPSGDAHNDRSVTEELANLDDVLGGQAASADPQPLRRDVPAGGQGADLDAPTDLEILLLLRQAAATERELADTSRDDEQPAVPPFEIVRSIGTGGFSTVYLAEDPRLGRSVALKVLRPEAMLVPGIRRRFIREAEITARLAHPGIVTVHDVGVSEGRVFIAQEYCEGGNLGSWLAGHEGLVPPRDAAAFLLEVAEAVHAAHNAGVLHRDLKPTNILLVRQHTAANKQPQPDEADSPGRLTAWRAKVADFGLATLLAEESNAELTRLTMTGCRLGTPMWMSPEQVDQSFGPISVATDVYALGLVLERLLSGRISQAALSEAETFRRILLDESGPFDSLAQMPPPGLAAIAAKCLQKRPQARYPSVAHLAHDLRRFLEGRPTIAPPLPPRSNGLKDAVASRTLNVLPHVITLAFIVASALSAFLLLQTFSSTNRNAVDSPHVAAAAEFATAFSEWRKGHIATASKARKKAVELQPSLAGSLTDTWFHTRIHGEDATLCTMPSNAAAFALAVSSDKSLAAAGSEEGTLAIIPLTPAPTSSSQPVFISVHDEINAITFTPDGKSLFVASETGNLTRWNVTTGKIEHKSRWPGALYGLACSPDGQQLVFGGQDRVLRIVATNAPDVILHTCDLSRFIPETDPSRDIESASFTGTRRVDLTFANHIVRVDTSSGAATSFMPVGSKELNHEHFAWSPETDLICITGGTEAAPLLLDAKDLSLVGSLPPHPRWVRCVDFSPSGALLATACRDGGIRVFDTKLCKEICKLIGHRGQVWRVGFLEEDVLLSCGDDGTVRRWTINTQPDRMISGQRLISSPGSPFKQPLSPARVKGVAAGRRLLPTQRLVVFDDMAQVRTFAPLAGEWSLPLQLRASNTPASLMFDVSADGTRAAVSLRSDPALQLISLPNDDSAPTPINILRDLSAEQFCWSHDNRLVLADYSTNRLLLFDPGPDAVTLLHNALEARSVVSLSASSASPLRVLAANPHSVQLITITSNEKVAVATHELPRVPGDVASSTWSPDDSLIACGTTYGVVYFYDNHTSTSVSIQRVSSHEHAIRSLAFDASGQTLISADKATMQIHDVATRTTLDEFRPLFEIHGVVLSPAGDTIVIVGEKDCHILPLNRSVSPE